MGRTRPALGLGLVLVGVGAARGAYRLLVRGALTLDLGVGRRSQPLGPIEVLVAAPPGTVFDVIAAPYLGPTPRAMGDKLRVLERGTDMVLAEHFTPVGRGMTATTLETVRFERPHRVHFRLVRGPVPVVVETFALEPLDVADDVSFGPSTRFTYSGSLDTDLGRLGERWGAVVARRWEDAVRSSVDAVKAEAERRAGHAARARTGT
jgi:hypothetical protein